MKGVAAFIKKQENGTIRLVFNDVAATSVSENPDWKHFIVFTSNDYDAETLRNLSLTKEQYAEIGENLVIRLLAMGGQL